MKDNNEEIFPVVDENGNIIGAATRGECHSGKKLLHPVVHLHVFNNEGELYLQKRPEWKDIQPGKWDTAVGGHVEYGELLETALFREAAEELGFREFNPVYLLSYVWESKREKELVNVFATVGNFELHPEGDEVSEGRYWSMPEIESAASRNIFTPNFVHEFGMVKDKLISLL